MPQRSFKHGSYKKKRVYMKFIEMFLHVITFGCNSMCNIAHTLLKQFLRNLFSSHIILKQCISTLYKQSKDIFT